MDNRKRDRDDADADGMNSVKVAKSKPLAVAPARSHPPSTSLLRQTDLVVLPMAQTCARA